MATSTTPVYYPDIDTYLEHIDLFTDPIPDPPHPPHQAPTLAEHRARAHARASWANARRAFHLATLDDGAFRSAYFSASVDRVFRSDPFQEQRGIEAGVRRIISEYHRLNYFEEEGSRWDPGFLRWEREVEERERRIAVREESRRRDGVRHEQAERCRQPGGRCDDRTDAKLMPPPLLPDLGLSRMGIGEGTVVGGDAVAVAEDGAGAQSEGASPPRKQRKTDEKGKGVLRPRNAGQGDRKQPTQHARPALKPSIRQLAGFLNIPQDVQYVTPDGVPYTDSVIALPGQGVPAAHKGRPMFMGLEEYVVMKFGEEAIERLDEIQRASKEVTMGTVSSYNTLPSSPRQPQYQVKEEVEDDMLDSITAAPKMSPHTTTAPSSSSHARVQDPGSRVSTLGEWRGGPPSNARSRMNDPPVFLGRKRMESPKP